MFTERRMKMAAEMRDLSDWLGETDDADIGALPDSHWDLMTLMLKAFVPIRTPIPISGDGRVTLSLIVSEVSLQMHVPAPIILSKDRRDHIACARQLAMYLCRRMTPLSYPKIGAFFNRDHSTVVHAERSVSLRMAGQPAFARTVEKIYGAILSRSSGAATGANRSAA